MTARRGFTLHRGLDTDPPSAASTRKPTLPFSVFDRHRLTDAIRRGLINGIPMKLPAPFNDERLIAVAMSLGMPRWSAEQMRYHPGLRQAYVGLTLDVEAAARGDRAARERVDAVRHRFSEDRRAERIADIPNRASGYVLGGETPTMPGPEAA